MRIALLTIWHEKNYGAELQAYATIKVLKNLGHEVKMIDIRLSDSKYVNARKKIIDFVTYFSPENRKFNRFWKKYIPTTIRYKSLNDLNINPPQADIYIVGSDQVWNPDITGNFTLLYFLNFGSDKIRRISYASSFGKEEWLHDDYYDIVHSLLERFSFLSCRESSGVNLLQEKFHLKAESVLDPTMLFEEYAELTGVIQEKSTLVYYPLSQDEELENYSIELASRLGLKAINNNRKKMLFGRYSWDRVGIDEWIRNIAQARFIITRSFHGLAFSLLYKKQFAVLASRNGRGDRLTDLLRKLGLSERMYSNVKLLNDSKPWEKQIDYRRVNDILKSERNKSIEFLSSSLKF